jgi:toxin secretion/phage lysis holin
MDTSKNDKKGIITMDKMDYVLAVIGAIAGYLLGGLDQLITVFATVFIVDTISGIIKSNISGTYSSKAFRKGILNKSGYLLAIILVVQLDKLLGNTGALRTALMFCFIYNEGVSVIENLGEMGVPIPEKIKDALEVLNKKSE